MLDAAREATGFASTRQRRDLDGDRLLVLGLVKSIEIVGEAGSKVTEDSRQAIPGIPWPQVIAMRNRLVHAYFDVNLDRVWDTIVDDLPPLILTLEAALVADKSDD